MKKKIFVESILGIFLLGPANYAFSEDAAVKLNSSDGTTQFIVQNSTGAAVFSVDSAGNTVINGTATVAGAEFSVGGSTFVVKGGNVGIGTAVSDARLSVRGADTQAYILAVGTSTTYSLVVSTNGNVGIGTTAPVYKTEVAGKLGLKTNGTDTGELKVGYTVTSPAGYYAVYAP